MAQAEFFANTWSLPPDAFELDEHEVHVWMVRAGAEHIQQDIVNAILSQDERERARRFKFDKDRRLYVAGHAALGALLAGYLRVSARDIHCVSGAHGKPALAPPHAVSGLEFNLSHSHELALVAFARGKAVGVDVEFVKKDFVFDELARRFFSAQEVAALFELPRSLQREAFFKCWTSKEAFLKAKGTGLSGKLDEVQINLTDRGLLKIEAKVPGWSLAELTPGEGYQAALAVKGGASPIRCYQWEFRGANFT